jgi:hypothetical protein
MKHTTRQSLFSTAALMPVVLLSAVVAGDAFAANCSNPPMPPGGRLSGTWWNSYSSWCRTCGGTPFQDSTGGGCRPGPNWGAQSSSGAGAMPFSMPSAGNPNDDLALGMAQLGTQMIIQGLMGSTQETPEQRARREEETRRAAETAAQRAAEEARQRELQHEELMSALLPTPGITPGTGSNSAAPSAKSSHFTKGFEDANGCYPQNAFGHCAAAKPEEQSACTNDYRAGFEVGDKRRALVMDEAYRAGERAGRAGERNGGFADTRAQGPCRLQWIETYNRGYFQGQHTEASK